MKSKSNVKKTQKKEVAPTNGAAGARDPNTPSDHVEKVSELEAMTFRALDAEIRNLQLSARTLTLEIQNSQVEIERVAAAHNKAQEVRRQQIEEVNLQLEAAKTGYLQMVTQIAEKYGLDPKMMAIDPEARTVRDLRGDA
jgi:hypothetical protein